MEDTFKVRVDRVFGSLSSSSQPLSSISSSLWCLTGEEIERREWNRDTSDATAADEEAEAAGPPPPFPSDLDGFFLANQASENPSRAVKAGNKDYRQELEDDLQCLDDDVGRVDGGERRMVCRGSGCSNSASQKPEDFEGDEDEWEIKKSIGLDCTLDYEEEEDMYDKVAVDRIKPDDRIYFRDFIDYGIRSGYQDELPENFKDVSRDPRANHLAAKLRLKEDAEAAKAQDLLPVSTEAALSLTNEQSNQSEVRNNHLKSILKRKESGTNSMLDKRVRFLSGSKENDEKTFGGERNCSSELHSDEQNSISIVPDYIRNPSRYMHYTFDDSSDMDDQSNQQTCMSFLSALRKSRQSEPDEPPADLSQPVIFNPKRKIEGGSVAKIDNNFDAEKEYSVGGFARKSNLQGGIKIGNVVEDGVCAMDEDAPSEIEAVMTRRNKATRQYRSRVNVQSNDLCS